MTTLIPILGDQPSHSLSSLGGADPATSVLLMMERSAQQALLAQAAGFLHSLD